MPGCWNSLRDGHGQAEVDQLERRGVLRADEVARADVAVDVAGLVDRLERLGRLRHQREAVAVEQLALADDQRVEARAVEKLHDHELLALGRDAVAERVDDARVVELTRRSRLRWACRARGTASRAASVFSLSRIFRPTICSVWRSRAM